MSYRLTRNHYRWQEGRQTLLPAGTLVEPTPEEFRAFPDLFAQVEAETDPVAPASPAPPAEAEPVPAEEEGLPAPVDTPESGQEPPTDDAPTARRRR